MGVVTWYQIEFPGQRIKVSSDVYSGDYLADAEISITYAIGQPGSFEVRFKDLPLRVTQALTAALKAAADVAQQKGTGLGPDAGGVAIAIHLGYLDDRASRAVVLAGRLESVESTSRFPPLGLLLSGHEEASFLLLNTVNIYHEASAPDLAHVAEPGQVLSGAVSPADVAGFVVKQCGAEMAGPAAPQLPLPGAPDPITTPLADQVTGEPVQIADDAEDGFHLLGKLADRFGAEVLAQEKKVMFGGAVRYPPPSGPGLPLNPAVVLALMTGDDSLIAVTDRGMVSTRLAEFRPAQIGGTSRLRASDAAPPADLRAFDFTVLGEPSLRAGQMAVASIDGYQDPTRPFRILNVTHAFSPEGGYTCTGRAVTFLSGTGNRQFSDLARPASAPTVADRIFGKIRDSQAGFPSVDVGKVKAAKAADRVASLFYRQPQNSTVSSPCVDLDVPEGKSVLLSKPVAAPFAWHNVGLSVPVYPGMRALLNQVRNSRSDSVVTGFLWANEPKMNPPPAKDGDWWLCLPTEVSGTPPKPTGASANDLIAADGRRVIEVPGLSVSIGKDKCSDLGKRPHEGPADVFLITHKTGTAIQIDADGNVTVDGKGEKVVLGCGGATLTVGKGKVAIT
jgi:hypothetical protein